MRYVNSSNIKLPCHQNGDSPMAFDNKTILSTLSDLSPLLKQKYGVTKIGIFGSVARNQANLKSDIDIVVEMHPDLFKRICLKNELESVLGKKVDVVRYHNGMNKLLKQRIDREGFYA
jgi:uncharacterized protein